MVPASHWVQFGRALGMLPLLALALPATSVAAQSSGLGGNESPPPSWIAFTGAMDLHVAGDQASTLALRTDTEFSGTVANGVRLEAEVGRRLRGLWIALHAGGSYHSHEDGPGSFEISGNTKSAKASLTFGLLQPNRMVNADLGFGILYLRSETVTSTAGEVIGLPGVNAGLSVKEWAPMMSASTTLRLLGNGSGTSLGLRMGVDIAATQDQPTVRIPLGLRLRFAR